MTIAESLIERGRIEGAEEASIEVAKRLLDYGIDLAAVAHATKLKSSHLKKIKRERS